MDRELNNSCIEYILEHLCDGLTARDVAEHFHYSRHISIDVLKQSPERVSMSLSCA